MTEVESPRAREEIEWLARRMRGSLASLRAAAETIERYPELRGERRARLLGVMTEETERIADQIGRLERLVVRTRPGEGAGATVDDLLQAFASAAADAGLECDEKRDLSGLPAGTAVAHNLDELAIQVAELLADLRRESAVARCRLRARVLEGHLLVDLGWQPEPGDLPLLFEWQRRALGARIDETESVGGLRRVVRALGGETWFILDRDGSGAHVRILLPLDLPVTES